MFSFIFLDKWVPVTTAWRILRLLMEKRPPRSVPPAMVLGEVLKLLAIKNWSCYEIDTCASDLD